MPSIDTLILSLKIAGFALPALGLVLLIVGLRGRRVGNARHCRHCRYNLTGVSSTRCPECGHDLTGPDTTRIGLRRVRKVPLGIGALLLLITLTGWSGEAYRRAKQIDPITLYPYYVLLDEAEQGGAAGLTEIRRRYSNGSLSDRQKRQLVEVVIKQHALFRANTRDSQPRLSKRLQELQARVRGLTDLLHQMIQKGDVTSDEVKDYYAQFGITWKVRAKIHAGDPICVEVEGKPDQVMVYQCVLTSVKKVTVSSAARDDGLLMNPQNTLPSSMRKISVARQSKSFPPLYIDHTENLTPGSHEYWMEGYLETVSPCFPFCGTGYSKYPFRIRETVEVLPKSVAAIQLIDRPDLAEELKSLITIEEFVYCGTSNQGKLQGALEITLGDEAAKRGLPMAVAFDVLVSDGNSEQIVTHVTCDQGESRRIAPNLEFPDFVTDEISVILRSSRDAAIRTCHMDTVWNGELVYEEILIMRP